MKRILFILVLVVGIIFYFITDSNELCNDYYDTVNRDFFKKDRLDKDEYIYSTFTLAQEKSNEVIDKIINDIVDGSSSIGVSDKVKILYNNVLDYNNRDIVGIKPLEKYIDMVMNSNNIDTLISNGMILENELGIDIFTRMVVDKDFVDNSKNIVYLYPVTFAFGSSTFYFADDNYMVYKAYIKKAIIDLLEEYGMNKSEARLVSSEVVSFYTDVSNSSKSLDSYEDVTSNYNIVNINYISDIYDKFNVDDYLSNRGINGAIYSLVDEGQYKKINDYLDDKYLMLWKKVILVKVLSSYANYLDLGYREVINNLNNNLTGTNKSNDLEEDAIDLVSSVFVNEVDEIYSKRVIYLDDINYLDSLFNDLKKCFKKILDNNMWLSEETKKRALEKLKAMKVYIGNYDENISDIEIEVKGDNLIDNIISINKSVCLRELDKLNNNRNDKIISDSEVNAYYNPMTNAVYIPSSVMFLFDNKDSYYEKLGTIGMVIAHEIIHGFDYNGSLFDSKGNLNNWWSDEDRNNFFELKNKVSDYYSKVEVLDGKYINGDKTVNENIADIGALNIITSVAMNNGASDNDLKVMYSSFAEFWRSQATDDYVKLLLLNDSHSPNKYRVNNVLSLIEEFYDVYNVYPWNEMYVNNGDRINIW